MSGAAGTLAGARQSAPNTPDRQQVNLPVGVAIVATSRPLGLAGAMASVWAQSRLLASEIVVVVHDEDEETAQLAAEAGAQVVRRPTHDRRGPTRMAVEAVEQPWVAVLEPQDQWLPHHLAVLWELREGRSFVSSSCVRHGRQAVRSKLRGALRGGLQDLQSPADLLRPGPAPIRTASTVMFSRKALLESGFDASLGRAAHLDLWLRLLERGSGLVTRDETVDCRAPGRVGQKNMPRMVRSRG